MGKYITMTTTEDRDNFYKYLMKKDNKDIKYIIQSATGNSGDYLRLTNKKGLYNLYMPTLNSLISDVKPYRRLYLELHQVANHQLSQYGLECVLSSACRD